MPHLGGLCGSPASIKKAEESKTPAFVQLPEILQPRTFNISSTIAEMSHSFNTNSFNNVSHYSYTVADDRSQLLTWLSPLEPRLRHRDIQERRIDNIGEWLMQTEEFRSWYDWSGEGEGDKAVLFGYGDPGAGKTFIRYRNKDYSWGEKR